MKNLMITIVLLIVLVNCNNKNDKLMYNSFISKIYQEKLYGLNDEDLFSLSEDEFVCTIDSVFKSIYGLTKLYLHKNKFQQEFIETENCKLKYKYFDLLTTYHRYRPIFTNERLAPTSKNYFDFLDSADFQNSELLELEEYKEFINSYTLDLYFILTINKPLSGTHETIALLNIVDENFNNPKIKNYLLSRIMMNQVNKHRIDIQTIGLFEKLCSDSLIVKKIEKEYSKSKSLFKGAHAPPFKLINIHDEIVELKDFYGKQIYIDVWSSFCVPCIEEFPYFSNLYSKLKDENVVFISVCLDGSIKKWKESIDKYKLKGELLFAEKGWKSEFARSYQIETIPCYIHIDKESKIISARSLKPSDIGLIKIIEDNF